MNDSNQAIARWKKQNPRLAADCKRASEILIRAQNQFIQDIADEVNDAEDLSGFTLANFIDTNGPRFQQLAIIVQAMSTLGE